MASPYGGPGYSASSGGKSCTGGVKLGGKLIQQHNGGGAADPDTKRDISTGYRRGEAEIPRGAGSWVPFLGGYPWAFVGKVGPSHLAAW